MRTTRARFPVEEIPQINVYFQINQEHFEFNVTSEVLLAEVKVCVPWNEIIKMESHFSNDLHALVIHVEVSHNH